MRRRHPSLGRMVVMGLIALATTGCASTGSGPTPGGSFGTGPQTFANPTPVPLSNGLPATAVRPTPVTLSSGNAARPNPGGGLPNLPNKPQPVASNFEGCPENGDGGDRLLNVRKNRTDEGQWYPVAINNLVSLAWPQSISRQPRQQWNQSDASAVARYEGIPIQVEGYLAGAKQQGPESCNCHAVDQVDNHLWIVDSPTKDRSQSVVAEITPRMRAVHPGWAYSRIVPLVDHTTKVRISGWLLMDQEHPDQIGKTRGTIWEIHPIMAFDVLQGNTWVPLDSGNAVARRSGADLVPTEDPNLPPPIVDPRDAQSNAAPPLPERTSGSAGGHTLHTGAVTITDIHYRGDIKPNEPDEYVDIANTGNVAVDISGWSLHDVYGGNTFRWSSYTLPPGGHARVYTDQIHPESGGFSFNSKRALWNNSGDAAELHDAGGIVVSTYGYGNKR